MDTLDRKALAEVLEARAFESRDFAIAAHAEALAAGKRREAISWAAMVRKIDKEIARYDLKRHELNEETLDRVKRLLEQNGKNPPFS